MAGFLDFPQLQEFSFQDVFYKSSQEKSCDQFFHLSCRPRERQQDLGLSNLGKKGLCRQFLKSLRDFSKGFLKENLQVTTSHPFVLSVVFLNFY